MSACDEVTASIHQIRTAGRRRKGPQYEPHSVNLLKIKALLEGRVCSQYGVRALGRHKAVLRGEDQDPFPNAVLAVLMEVVLGSDRVVLDDADDTIITFETEDTHGRRFKYTLTVDEEAFECDK